MEERMSGKGDKGFKGEQIYKWVVLVTMCLIFYFVANCMQILLEGKWIRNCSYISPHVFKNIRLFS